VPELVTIAEVPAAPVVVVPTTIVAAVPVAPVGPCGPVAPVAPVSPRGIVNIRLGLMAVPVLTNEALDPGAPVITVPNVK